METIMITASFVTSPLRLVLFLLPELVRICFYPLCCALSRTDCWCESLCVINGPISMTPQPSTCSNATNILEHLRKCRVYGHCQIPYVAFHPLASVMTDMSVTITLHRYQQGGQDLQKPHYARIWHCYRALGATSGLGFHVAEAVKPGAQMILSSLNQTKLDETDRYQGCNLRIPGFAQRSLLATRVSHASTNLEQLRTNVGCLEEQHPEASGYV